MNFSCDFVANIVLFVSAIISAASRRTCCECHILLDFYQASINVWWNYVTKRIKAGSQLCVWAWAIHNNEHTKSGRKMRSVH